VIEMTETNRHHALVKDDSTDRFSSDLETLKSSFAQLRKDLSKFVGNTVDTGKDGAEAIKDGAADAVGALKDRVVDGKDRVVDLVDQLEQRISQRPLMSAAIAIGVGFFLGKLLKSKR
jgi:ElaB/YqjD/DUF883 family membrane-anchored ribosome-binding protein